jgi:acyl carrier protein
VKGELAMTRAQILQKLRSLISEQLDVSAEEVYEDSEFLSDLGADSLDIVDLVMKIEDEFNLAIDDEDAQEMQTVRRVIDYLEQTLQPSK